MHSSMYILYIFAYVFLFHCFSSLTTLSPACPFPLSQDISTPLFPHSFSASVFCTVFFSGVSHLITQPPQYCLYFLTHCVAVILPHLSLHSTFSCLIWLNSLITPLCVLLFLFLLTPRTALAGSYFFSSQFLFSRRAYFLIFSSYSIIMILTVIFISFYAWYRCNIPTCQGIRCRTCSFISKSVGSLSSVL